MSKMQDELLKIGEFSILAGVSKRTIRYYQSLGLLSPTERTEGGFRLFSNNDLQRIRIIKQFKELDFSLEEIRDVFSSTTSSNKSERIKGSKNILIRQLEEIENKINDLQGLKDRTKKALDLLNKCDKCQKDNCSKDCPSQRVHF